MLSKLKKRIKAVSYTHLDVYKRQTLVSASTLQKEVKAELEKTNNVDAAAYLGTVIAKRAIEKGINTVVFDRGGFIYQGKIKALADAAREAGLEFQEEEHNETKSH